MRTLEDSYADYLRQSQESWWRRLFDVQRPYRRNIRRLEPGLVLDVGCGTGRNLAHLDGRGVGVDHNPHSVAQARSRGLEAYTVEAFAATRWNRSGAFDALLCSHVLEHMSLDDARQLLRGYLPLVRVNGKVILIVPQAAGFRSDSTHETFLDPSRLAALVRPLPLVHVQTYSFPFNSRVGRLFRHNETVALYLFRGADAPRHPAGVR